MISTFFIVALSAVALSAPAPRAQVGECAEQARAIREASAEAKDSDAPSWVAPGVPGSVWRLVEASAAVDDEDDLRRCLLREAEADAHLALEETPGNVGRHFALAVVLGMRANTEGGRTKVLAASELHTELRALLEIAPDHAQARHMLGRLHAGVRRMNRVTRWIATNLLGGGALKEATWEEAERNLAFAARAAPEVMDHHLQLANLYRDTDQPGQALEAVRRALALPATTAMEEAVQAEAREVEAELLKELGG